MPLLSPNMPGLSGTRPLQHKSEDYVGRVAVTCPEVQLDMSYSLNSLNGEYIGDTIGDDYRAY